MNSDARESVAIVGLIRPLATVVAWIGASVGALTAVLSALGYLVESGYLASLGLRRGMLELTSVEYLATGGQFVVGLVPMSVLGALSFIIDFWWAALLVGGAFVLGMWRKFGQTYRWLMCAGLNAIWLGWAIPKLDAAAAGNEAYHVLSMMTFVAMLSLLYALLEHMMAVPNRSRNTLVSQIVFYAIFSVTLLTLPYARGSKGLERELPSVQLTAKDAGLLCELAHPVATKDGAWCVARTWRLVQFGKDRSVLLDPQDGSLYVVPAAITSTLRIVKKGSDKP